MHTSQKENLIILVLFGCYDSSNEKLMRNFNVVKWTAKWLFPNLLPDAYPGHSPSCRSFDTYSNVKQFARR
jgi:hypothetical protein